MTHPQQSTAEAIFRLVSPPKRQAMQGKSLSCRRYTLELLPTCENIGLQSHLGPRNSQALPNHTSDTPPMHPQPLPGDPQPHLDTPPDAPLPLHPHSLLTPATPPMHPSLCTHTPPNPSHTPDVPLPPQIRMQFPNRSDSVIQSDTNKQVAQRELHAKLQHLRPLAGPVATPHGGHRAQAATHPDR